MFRYRLNEALIDRDRHKEAFENQNRTVCDLEAEIALLRKRIDSLETDRDRDKKEIARLTDALNRARIVSRVVSVCPSVCPFVRPPVLKCYMIVVCFLTSQLFFLGQLQKYVVPILYFGTRFCYFSYQNFTYTYIVMDMFR